MQIRTILITVGLAITLTHCASYDFSRKIVQQGNLLPAAKIEKLKLGMNKEEVAVLMGTSLLSPTFTNDRWDYAYSWRKGSSSTRITYLSLYFSHGVLSRVEKGHKKA